MFGPAGAGGARCAGAASSGVDPRLRVVSYALFGFLKQAVGGSPTGHDGWALGGWGVRAGRVAGVRSPWGLELWPVFSQDVRCWWRLLFQGAGGPVESGLCEVPADCCFQGFGLL